MTAPVSAAKRDRVIIFATTMRDGEQSPGASMSHDEKLELAKILEEMGVDVIEAGFPIASNGDFEAVRAARGRIHPFISTSPVHMKWKLQMEPEAVLEAVTASVSRARNLCGDVEWSAEDATSTDRAFLYRCVE